MKFIILIFMIMMAALSARADQNADIIKRNKITFSTTVMLPATTNLVLTCLSNRQIVLNGTFNGTQLITLPSVACVDGTRFNVQHAGTGDVLIKNSGGTTLKTATASDMLSIVYYSNNVSVFSYGDEAFASSGGSFDPNSSPIILPAVNGSYTLGNASFVWLTLFARTINSGSSTLALATTSNIAMNASQGASIFTSNNSTINFNAGSVIVANDAIAYNTGYTLSLGTIDCPSGACTSASPYLIPTLTPSTTCTSPTALSGRTCTANIYIELANATFPSTTDKYICIQGINYGAADGQILNIKIINRSSNVTNFVIGFASPLSPITGCSYQGDSILDVNNIPMGTFKLNYSAAPATVAGGAFPAVSTMLPRNQFMYANSSFNTYYNGSNTFNTSRISGSISFMYSQKDGWIEQ